jgi:hypothetical protein
MTTQTLRNALILLPTLPRIGSQGPIETTPLVSGFRLPRWERHPFSRSDHSTGSMDQEWIRTHLP